MFLRKYIARKIEEEGLLIIEAVDGSTPPLEYRGYTKQGLKLSCRNAGVET